jgi:phenylpropionate dioxygenase-like ring-hydroxylating dioxygenase large terminal subunit
MNQDLQIDLVKRVHAHIHAKTTDTDGDAAILSIDAYADPSRLRREIDALFFDKKRPQDGTRTVPNQRRPPLAIAHSSQLPKPGDFITHDVSGTPYLVMRRDDGGLDAFLNVCRHRGTRVESEPSGNKRAFSCPYHGWTYGKRGQLITVPHAQGFACIDKSTRGLVQVPCAEVSGIIFVNGSDEDVRTYLGPIADDLDSFGITTSHHTLPLRTERPISWKLAIDIFLETYHLRPTHKDTIYPMFFDNLGLVDRIGPHLRNVFPKRSIHELEGTEPSTWSLRLHANVLYHLFPNTLVLVQPDHAAILNVWPVGTDRAIVDAYSVVPEAPSTDKARGYWKANADILYGATREDFMMGESIQRGLGSGANHDVVFGSYEHALRHFHDGIARYSA